MYIQYAMKKWVGGILIANFVEKEKTCPTVHPKHMYIYTCAAQIKACSLSALRLFQALVRIARRVLSETSLPFVAV